MQFEIANQETDELEQERVPSGMGALKGWQPLQHVDWASGVSHPALEPSERASKALWQAISFECEHSPEEIDDFRMRKLATLIKRSKQMREHQREWASKAPERIRPVVESIHGPLLRQCLLEVCEDRELFSQLLEDLQQGFPLIGD